MGYYVMKYTFKILDMQKLKTDVTYYYRVTVFFFLQESEI